MDKDLIARRLAALPIYQYEFLGTEKLQFEPKVRAICRSECPMYGRTWSCPPAVGSFEACRSRCLSFPEALLITTVAEVADLADLDGTLATRRGHEDITRQVRGILADAGCEVFVLSSEACALCRNCTWPDAPCRHPEQMFPCIESHCILVTALAERYGLDFIAGSGIVTWFSLLFYKQASATLEGYELKKHEQ